jgi:hypothetical protein
MEEFFITGKTQPHSDLLFDLFAFPEKIYSAWESVKHLLRRQHKRLRAWSVFESGTVECLGFAWINKESYEKWKENNED